MKFNNEWVSERIEDFCFWLFELSVNFLIFFMKITAKIMLFILACQMIYVYFKW